MAGELAYANDNVRLLPCVAADLSRLRDLGEPIEPQAHRQRVGVVAVVDDRHAAEEQFIQSTLYGTHLGQRGLDNMLGNAKVQRDRLGDVAGKVGAHDGALLVHDAL